MELNVLHTNASPEDSFRTENWSASGTFDNVFALLDEERSRQLVERVIPAVTYTGSFETVGADDGLDPPTQLCSPCKRLMQDPPPMFKWWQHDDLEEDSLPARFWVPHHDTLFQLIDCCFSRVGRCRLCHLLWHGIRRETLRHRSIKAEEPKIGWHDGGLKVALSSDPTFGISLERKKSDLTYLIRLNILLKTRRGLCDNFYIKMVHKYGEDASIFQGPMADSTGSFSTFCQITSWIRVCSESHSLCQTPEPSDSERPTRLIFLDYLAGTFQLTTNFATDTKYAAVSYRWGSGKDCYLLTQETAEEMRHGASMAILPKTLLDTCTAAHHIGLKYVWIDRLCIYQDSLEDWSQEASRMAFIYKHAFITISASCASHENQGCFKERNAAGIQPLRLVSNPLLPSLPPGFLQSSSYIISEESQEDHDEIGKLGCLADRGWVFQERVLSRRIAHFAQEEVHWECSELETKESWPADAEFGHSWRPTLLYGPDSEYWGKHSVWHHVVEAYSASKFTYDSDKLPAISGLAREWAELRKDPNDEYLAGLWRSTVLVDLCWETCQQTPRIPEEYLAPSWSWASLHTKIGYPGCFKSNYTPMAEFKGSRLRFATADAYGAVLDGWMHLSGHLKPVTVAPVQPHWWAMEVLDINGTPFSFLEDYSAQLDMDPFAAGGSRSVPAFCLPVVEWDQDGWKFDHILHCLLLVPNGSIEHTRPSEALNSPETPFADEYQRAGLAQMKIKDEDWLAFKAWLTESPERDIVIR